MNQAKKKNLVVPVLLLTLTLIVTACATSQQKDGGTLPVGETTQAKATLSHTPTGTSDLKWNAANQTLTVTVHLTGLAPKSTHPGHIHKGDCGSNGATVHSINPVVADDKGVGMSETTIQQVKEGIPQSGWYINIHNGPELTTPLQKIAITCGEIVNSNASTSSDQSVQVTLGSTPDENQAASGNAELSVAGDKLTVKVTLSGLAPNSTHIAHIHEGSCEAQGAVKYPLTSIVADASGKGTSTTTVEQVTAVPANGWYVNVHLGAPDTEKSAQTGGDGIACGNVVLG